MARFSKRSLEGELYIDHSAGPGLTLEEVGHFNAPAVAKGEVYESAILVCGHCQAAIILNPNRSRDRGWCAKCDHYMCDDCTELAHVTLECRSFERLRDTVLEWAERGASPLLFPKV